MVRLTAVLATRHRATYHWKRKWRLYVEKEQLRGPIVPEVYMQKGVKIVNAAMEQKEHEEQIEGFFDWKPDHPMFKPAVGTDRKI